MVRYCTEITASPSAFEEGKQTKIRTLDDIKSAIINELMVESKSSTPSSRLSLRTYGSILEMINPSIIVLLVVAPIINEEFLNSRAYFTSFRTS